jgi:hydroxyacid-oxoacid transhydrogenase
MAASNIRFGVGSTREIGMDLGDMGLRHVLVVTDPQVSRLPVTTTVLASLENENVRHTLFKDAHVEPTDESLRAAVDFAQSQTFDGFVAVARTIPVPRRRRSRGR